jgi:glutathione S-transferase
MHQMTDGRREVERLTGQHTVPVLVTDDGDVITESQEIVAWAKAHPARTASAA